MPADPVIGILEMPIGNLRSVRNAVYENGFDPELVGADADFAVFAPDDRQTVDAARLQHKNPITPYAGRQLTGVVRSTWLRGVRIDIDAPPRGRQLTRGE